MSKRARLVGINHVALEVEDLGAALEFYGAVFEFELRGRIPGMAFLDMGDQFLALMRTSSPHADRHRHFGLVVDDRSTVRERAERAGAKLLDGPFLDFLDPWGNHWQVVDYSEVQFTKAPEILEGMGHESLKKSEKAMEELRRKGLAPG